jgi:hypothetical protein
MAAAGGVRDVPEAAVRSKWASFGWFLLALSAVMASCVSLSVGPSIIPTWAGVLCLAVNAAMTASFAVEAVRTARYESRRP